MQLFKLHLPKHLFGYTMTTNCLLSNIIIPNAVHMATVVKQLCFDVQGVFTVDFEKGLTLTEIGEGISVEDIRAATKCNFKVRVQNNN